MEKKLSDREAAAVSIPTQALGSVCDVIAGQHIPAEEHNSSGQGTPYLTGPADFGVTTPTISKWTNSPRQFARVTDVLVTVKGAGVGKSNYSLDVAIGRQIMALRPRPKTLDRGYLFHWIRANEATLNALGQGATVPGISKPDLERFPIPLFPLPEQRRIADILDKADAIRRKRKEAIALTEELLRSAFLDMFGDPVTNPKGWPVVELRTILVDGPQNGLYRPSSDYGSGTPIIRIDSFYDGEVEGLDGLKRVRIEPELVDRYSLREGDLVINRVNSRKYLGKSAIVPRLNEATVFESNMMRMTFDRGRAHPGFIVAELQQPSIRRQIDSAAKDAVNQSSINQGDVMSFRLRLPPLEVQTKYAGVADQVRASIHRRTNAAAVANVLLNSLIARAFSGSLEPSC
jgi:type I restriction enzyme S subunit